MDSRTKGLEMIVELLKKHNINQIVISPGGTNIPFVRMVQEDKFFKCYSVVDERSAMYFAIGLYIETGKPVVTSCTSAQATRNYVPGLTEAFYKHVPILAITMSKHPRFTYQEYMQAPDQISLPRDCVKKSYYLPFINDENDVFHSIRLINEAILELDHREKGPVQLCVPWLDFPLTPCEPLIRDIKRYTISQKWDVNLSGKRIMLVIGENQSISEKERRCIDRFSEVTNSIIYVNHLSNYKGKYSVEGNLALLTLSVSEFTKKYAPDIIISIYGQTGDYSLYNKLSCTELKGCEHWRINYNGDVVDTYDKLTRIFECSLEDFFDKILKENCSNQKDKHNYYDAWIELCNELSIPDELPFSNAAIAQYMAKKIPQKSRIQFSILNSLRIWNFFSLDPTIKCSSNVGAFGIDGGLSTLIGQSVVCKELCFMIIGDLAFYYDMNSLGIRHIKNNLRILIINNNGGIEFKLSNRENSYLDKYIAAANHFKNAEGWAETCGFIYHSATNMNEFKNCVQSFIQISEKPQVLEVFVSDSDEAIAYNMIIDQNKNNDLSSGMKQKIKKIIGDDNARKIKGLFNQ